MSSSRSREGEILGLVGESGSGKSTIALALLRLLDHKGGIGSRRSSCSMAGICFNCGRARCGRFAAATSPWCCKARIASLNPALRIGTQIAEAWRAHNPEARLWKQRALELFDLVSLPAEEGFLEPLSAPAQRWTGAARSDRDGHSAPAALVDRRRIHQCAGRHYAIGNSGAVPRLNRELNMAMLFISHDLLSVASVCQRIAILQNGRIIESGSTRQMFREPRTEDTRALLQAVLRNSLAATDLVTTTELAGVAEPKPR